MSGIGLVVIAALPATGTMRGNGEPTLLVAPAGPSFGGYGSWWETAAIVRPVCVARVSAYHPGS